MIPTHAYIPGRTARHPGGCFEALRATVRPGMTPDALAASEAWRTGLAYYREGYFWECHEVLEAVWMATRANSAERRVAQAVIQLANARLKAEMGRPNAVGRLADIAEAHLAEARLRGGEALGIRAAWIRDEAAELRALAERMRRPELSARPETAPEDPPGARP